MMLMKLASLIAVSIMASAIAHDIIEITAENPPNLALAGFEFAVINFYDDSAASVEVKKIFHEAMVLFKEEEKLGSRSVGWAQVDVIKYSELSIAAPDISYPSQLIAAAGSMRKVTIKKLEGESDHDTALKFAKDAAKLSNDMFIEISCEEIEKFIDENRLFFVYFGSLISLDRTHTQMRQVVAFDRFTFNDHPVQFFINTDE